MPGSSGLPWTATAPSRTIRAYSKSVRSGMGSGRRGARMHPYPEVRQLCVKAGHCHLDAGTSGLTLRGLWNPWLLGRHIDSLLRRRAVAGRRRTSPDVAGRRRTSPGAFVGSCYSATLGRALILRVSETLGPGSVRPAGAGCRPRAPSFGFCSRHIDAAPLCVRVREVLAPSAAGVGAADHRDWAVCMMQHGLAHRSEQ